MSMGSSGKNFCAEAGTQARTNIVEIQNNLENMVELYEWAHAFRTEPKVDSPEDALLRVKSKTESICGLQFS